MRRRQILPENDLAQKARFALPPTVTFTDAANVQQVRELRPPADHEACPLCGRKKQGRPKSR